VARTIDHLAAPSSRFIVAGDIYRVLADAMNDGALILESGTAIVYCNRSFASLVGLAIDAVVGSTVDRFVLREDQTIFAHLLPAQARGAARGELRLRANDGAIVPVLVSVNAFRPGAADDGTNSVCVVVTDLTAQKQIEQLRHAQLVERRERTRAEDAHRRVRDALQASQQHFRGYFDLGLIGMAITAPDKGCLEVNDELCRILGYPREELLRITWAEITHPADLPDEVAHFNRVMSGDIDGYSIDKRWIRKDGSIIDSIMAAKCVRAADGSVEYFVGLVQDITERKKGEAERRELMHRLIDAQEVERRRIALDIHDQFGQQLSVLRLKLSALRRPRGRRTNLTEQVARLEAIVRRLDADLDVLISRLHPPWIDDQGLVAALENYVARWAEQFGIEAGLHANVVDEARLQPEIETGLYRIVQEALNNIAKHARARSAVVLLDRGLDQLSLIVEDDGVGFNVELLPHAVQSFGITGMRERAMLLGGSLEVESAPGSGTTVAVRIQLPRGSQGASS
jgi:PAS domain S-box-containing protein